MKGEIIKYLLYIYTFRGGFMPNMMISMPDEMYIFVKEQQKKGLKPSKVFQDAVLKVKRQINEGIDLSEIAIAAKFDRFQQLIMKLNAFIEKRGLYYAFLEYEKTGRDQVEGIPSSKGKD